jgi:hypothetical protein
MSEDNGRATIKDMVELIGIDEGKAIHVLSIVDNEWQDRYELGDHLRYDKTYVYPRTARWVAQCYHCPSITELKMSMIDEVLDNYGVEGINLDEHGFNCWFSYSNNGRTYKATIGYCPLAGEFIVTSWGDYYEWAEREGHVSREERDE